MAEKLCNSCKLPKNLEEDFGKDRSSKTGYTDNCKKCRNAKARKRSKAGGYYERRNKKHKEYRRAYYKKPEVLDRMRDKWLREKYGMTIQGYYDILEKQGGRCAVCRTEASEERSGRLVVDHCHASSVVRGLLCQACNRGLGLLKDDPDVLRNAISYLRKNPKTKKER